MAVMEIVEKNSQLHLKFSEKEEALRKYAFENHVPIIQDEGLAFLEMLIRLKKPKKILEIGTAIGYSAIRMHQVCGSDITTIERNQAMFQLAKQNIQNFGYESSIHILFEDALNAFSLVEQNQFDFIFIDAAKAQYKKFFELYTPLLSANGIVVCDNCSFHGLAEDEDAYENLSRSVKGLVRKLNDFKNYLLNNEMFDTTILPIGDGMAVAVRK